MMPASASSLGSLPRRTTPARAGKTRTFGAGVHQILDHPRTRGEDTRCRHVVGPCSGPPPHARGRPRAARRHLPGCGTTPARAGKTRPRRRRALRHVVFPACAGVVLEPRSVITGCPPSSPRARGWSRRRVHGLLDPGGLPRVRGGGPDIARAICLIGKSSPRARGWSIPGAARPARARRLPRVRGGGPHVAPASKSARKSSPRARGWSGPCRRGGAEPPVFPACAGVVRSAGSASVLIESSPVRGWSWRGYAFTHGSGCSPHARGTRRGSRRPGPGAGGATPACAGKTLVMAAAGTGPFGPPPHARGRHLTTCIDVGREAFFVHF